MSRVSLVHIRGLIEAVAQVGISAEVLFDEAGLALPRMLSAEHWVELEVFDQLLAAAVDLTQDRDFGLHWGEHAPMMQFDVMPPLVAQCPDLRACLDAIVCFQPLFSELPELILVERRSTLVLRCDPLAIHLSARKVRADLFVTGLLRLLRYLGVRREAVANISFGHERPADVTEYRRLVGDCTFGRAHTSIELLREELNHPHTYRDGELYERLLKQVALLRVRSTDRETFAKRVKLALRQSLPEIPEMAVLARSFGMSERSLRRRLQAESCSFLHILAEARRELARDLLARGRPLKELSSTLGFGTTSSYLRASRRWSTEERTD